MSSLCKPKLLCLVTGVALTVVAGSACARGNPELNAYFGDTHAHSMLSGDDFGFGNRLAPDNAYKLARGDEAEHVGGYKIKLKAPLDFFMVTDHAEMIGIAQIASDSKSAMYNTEVPALSCVPKAAGFVYRPSAMRSRTAPAG